MQFTNRVTNPRVTNPRVTNPRAVAYRQEAERLRQQATETQNSGRRIDLFMRAQHYDVLASTEEKFDRRSYGFRGRLRYPPYD
jgi:hypothetical protein